MRLYELIIQDENIDEVFAISMVENPAIEAMGMYFHKEEVHFAEMNEEGLFMAPILIPNKRILRVDGKGIPYEVYFSPETIKRLSQMYLEKKYQDSVTLEHDTKVMGVTMVETWIKESHEKDKSKLYGLNAPVGSWLGTFKIDNEEIKEKFRKGDIRAVSIEGIFEHMEKSTHEQMKSAQLWESFEDYMNKDVEELTELEASKVLLKLKEVLEKTSNNSDIQEFESYTDYPKQATENAKTALRWADENGWGSCGTEVGKRRANQLANGEAISRDTIARMAAFERHRQNSKKELGDGCGRLMWLAWGGDAGVEWAQRKLKRIDASVDLAENAGGFSVGDYVSWTFAGRGSDDDRARGQITDLRVSGTVDIPDSNATLNATEEEPVALIKTRTGKIVGQHTRNLRKIQKPDDFSFVGYLDELPIYSTKEEAEAVSKIIGCSGAHEHMVGDITVWMPCDTHQEVMDSLLKDLHNREKSIDLESNPQVSTTYPGERNDSGSFISPELI